MIYVGSKTHEYSAKEKNHYGVGDSRSDVSLTHRPFGNAEVGGNDDAGALIEFADQVEQQCATRLAEGQVAKLIQYHQIGVDQPIGNPPLLTGRLFLFQGIDQFDRGEEPYPLPVVLNGLYVNTTPNPQLFARLDFNSDASILNQTNN